MNYPPGFVLAKLLRKVFQPPAVRASRLDRTARVCSGSQLAHSTLGRYSYIGRDCVVIYTSVGQFTSIGDSVTIGGAAHPLAFVSMSPVFCRGRNIMGVNFGNHDFFPYQQTYVGSDVWIGSNCSIKAGVRVGDGSVIGTGSVVTKDVGPYEIWAGNPARLIRRRFDEQLANALLCIKWWDWPESRIAENGPLFSDVSRFVEVHKSE